MTPVLASRFSDYLEPLLLVPRDLCTLSSSQSERDRVSSLLFASVSPIFGALTWPDGIRLEDKTFKKSQGPSCSDACAPEAVGTDTPLQLSKLFGTRRSTLSSSCSSSTRFLVSVALPCLSIVSLSPSFCVQLAASAHSHSSLSKSRWASLQGRRIFSQSFKERS